MNDYSVKKVNSNTVKICCRGRGCPQLKDLGNGTFELTDDNGNVVVLKREELALVGDAVNIISNVSEKLILG